MSNCIKLCKQSLHDHSIAQPNGYKWLIIILIHCAVVTEAFDLSYLLGKSKET